MMFLKLKQAESNRDVYVNFDRVNFFYYAEKERCQKNMSGTKIVFDSNEYEESWEFVKETPEKILEMLNGGKPAIRMTAVQHGESNFQIGHVDELTI